MCVGSGVGSTVAVAVTLGDSVGVGVGDEVCVGVSVGVEDGTTVGDAVGVGTNAVVAKPSSTLSVEVGRGVGVPRSRTQPVATDATLTATAKMTVAVRPTRVRYEPFIISISTDEGHCAHADIFTSGEETFAKPPSFRRKPAVYGTERPSRGEVQRGCAGVST